MSISIVALSHNRLHLLRRCVENVLYRTSDATREIVIWDNASTDETRQYLDALSDPRVRIIHHPRNIGQNAYAIAFRQTNGEYMVEVDDDVIEAPESWDLRLLEAFQRLPDIGYLAANLVNNPHDTTAQAMYGRNAHLYKSVVENGVQLKLGPTGGGCTMTSRELHDRVGGFRQSKRHVFWLEDAAYIDDIQKLGFRAAYLEDLQVLHAGGPYYGALSAEKAAYWRNFARTVDRKNAVKRALLHIPFVRPLNNRFHWFVPPGPEWAEARTAVLEMLHASKSIASDDIS